MSKDLKHIEMLIGGDIYNLHVSELPKFQEKFGVVVNGINEDEFIKWAKENHILFIKKVCVELSVGIDEYLRNIND